MKFKSKYKTFIHGNALENVVCQMAAICLSLNVSRASPISIRNPNIVIIVPADELAPNGTRPSALLIIKSDILSSRFFWMQVIYIIFVEQMISFIMANRKTLANHQFPFYWHVNSSSSSATYIHQWTGPTLVHSLPEWISCYVCQIVLINIKC